MAISLGSIGLGFIRLAWGLQTLWCVVLQAFGFVKFSLCWMPGGGTGGQRLILGQGMRMSGSGAPGLVGS